MKRKSILVIDQGTYSTRAIVFDSAGYVVAAEQQSCEFSYREVSTAEQDPKQLFQSLTKVLVDLSGKLTDSQKQQLSEVAFISQRSSIVAYSQKTASAISPIVSWLDTRNTAFLNSLSVKQMAVLRHKTGLRINPHVGAAKMQHLLSHNQAVHKAAENNDLLFLSSASYLLYSLLNLQQGITETPKIDAVIAARMYLTEFMQTRWSSELLDLFQLEESYLAEVVPSQYSYGVMPEMLGFPAGLPVTLLGGDQNFLSYAYGEKQRLNSVFVNAGTGVFIQAYMKVDEIPDALLKTAAAINTDENEMMCLAEATINNGASLLEWWCQKNETLVIEDVEEIIKKAKGKDIPVFIAREFATGSPYWLEAGKSYFSNTEKNIEFDAGLAEQTAAVFESLVFSVVDNLQLMLSASDEVNNRLNKIVISGGVAKSDWFCQQLANLSERPVYRYLDNEASARGAAFYLFKDVMVDLLSQAEIFKPNNNADLKARFISYQSIIVAER